MSSSPKPHDVVSGGIAVHGWNIRTLKGPIIADRDVDAFRQSIGVNSERSSPVPMSLPEMLFDRSRVVLRHEASGWSLDLNAHDALAGWLREDLPPLQVKVAEEWRRAREHEIKVQRAVQLEYDWTFTTPYTGTLTTAPMPSSQGSAAADAPATGPSSLGPAAGGTSGSEAGTASAPQWESTTEQIDRALLMERDPILFYDEVPLYESDLDDNGVCQLTAKLRVMPKCWFLLLRLWLRVDGCMVRLRETRLFCRHDLPDRAGQILREVKHFEGAFGELRAAGGPDEGPAYADGDAAAQVFGAIAPIGLKKFELHKLQLP